MFWIFIQWLVTFTSFLLSFPLHSTIATHLTTTQLSFGCCHKSLQTEVLIYKWAMCQLWRKHPVWVVRISFWVDVTKSQFPCSFKPTGVTIWGSWSSSKDNLQLLCISPFLTLTSKFILYTFVINFQCIFCWFFKNVIYSDYGSPPPTPTRSSPLPQPLNPNSFPHYKTSVHLK